MLKVDCFWRYGNDNIFFWCVRQQKMRALTLFLALSFEAYGSKWDNLVFTKIRWKDIKKQERKNKGIENYRVYRVA